MPWSIVFVRQLSAIIIDIRTLISITGDKEIKIKNNNNNNKNHSMNRRKNNKRRNNKRNNNKRKNQKVDPKYKSENQLVALGA